MAKLSSPFVCDECNALKSQSGRLWFLQKEDADAFEMIPWDEELASEAVFHHICDNTDCGARALKRWQTLQVANVSLLKTEAQP